MRELLNELYKFVDIMLVVVLITMLLELLVFNLIKYKKDNYIKGIINVDKDKTTLFTTIPYNKGWNIYVDNKKINYSTCTESFICLDLSQGNHTIEFKFIPKGFIIGSIISLITLITTIIYTRKK